MVYFFCIILIKIVQERKSKSTNQNHSFLHSYYYGENGDSLSAQQHANSHHPPAKSHTLGPRPKSKPESFQEPATLQNNRHNHKKSILKPERNLRNYELQKTKSDDCIVDRPSPTLPRMGKLQKTKSSTFISPEQSDNLFYKSKVTLTLRRSRSNLNEELDACGEKQTYYYGEGLPTPDKPPIPILALQEKVLRRAEELRSQCPTPPPLMSKPSLQKTVC